MSKNLGSLQYFLVFTGKWDDWRGQEDDAEYYEPHADDPEFNVSVLIASLMEVLVNMT